MQALIFDMDGVIVDSEPIWIASKQLMLKEQGINVPESYHYDFFGTTLAVMWRQMQADFNLDLTVSECIARGEAIRRELLAREPLKSIPGAIPLIKRLHQAGIPLAIASSSSNRDIATAVDSLGIRQYFNCLVSGEDCEQSKPFPDVFLKAAEELGVEPNRCLVIEDATNGVKAAKRAGMKCLGFANPAFTKQNLSEADQIVTDFDQLTVDDCQGFFQ